MDKHVSKTQREKLPIHHWSVTVIHSTWRKFLILNIFLSYEILWVPLPLAPLIAHSTPGSYQNQPQSSSTIETSHNHLQLSKPAMTADQPQSFSIVETSHGHFQLSKLKKNCSTYPQHANQGTAYTSAILGIYTSAYFRFKPCWMLLKCELQI